MMRARWVVIVPAIVAIACSSAASDSSSSDLPDPNGEWCVSVTIDSCGTGFGQKTVVVANDAFDATIFSYTSGPCTETIRVAGTLTRGNASLVLRGNQYSTGNCCNGGQGFFTYIDAPWTTGVSDTRSVRFDRGACGGGVDAGGSGDGGGSDATAREGGNPGPDGSSSNMCASPGQACNGATCCMQWCCCCNGVCGHCSQDMCAGSCGSTCPIACSCPAGQTMTCTTHGCPNSP